VRAPAFGALAELSLSGAGAHAFELRNASGPVYVDRLCVSEGSSDSQPASGPGETTTQTSALALGDTLTRQLTVPADAEALAVVTESDAPVPYKLLLLDPNGTVLATTDSSKEGIASLDAPVSSAGTYLLQLVNLGLSPVELWSAATPQVTGR
jgi:hypothetical protein